MAHMLKFLEQTYISWSEVNSSLLDMRDWSVHSQNQLAMYSTATDSTDIQVALKEVKVKHLEIFIIM